MRVPSAALLVLACTACLDLELVAPVRPADPELSVLWRFRQDTTTALELSAEFWPGAEFAGVPLPPDARLHLDGEPVSATASYAGGWHFTRNRDLAGVVPASLVLVIPARGVTLAARTIELPVMQRAGPAQLTLAAGEDLRLALTETVASQPDSILMHQWTLEVAPECGVFVEQALSASARAKPPAEIVVPREWLQNVVAGTTSVCFRYLTFYEPRTAPYAVRITRSVEIMWRITVEELP